MINRTAGLGTSQSKLEFYMPTNSTAKTGPNYKPNLNDPRTAKRIKHAYGLAKSMFNDEAQQFSQGFLTKHFGRSNDNLGKWLRKQLITCVDHHYSEAAGVAKKYVLNTDGAASIKADLLGNFDKLFTPVEVKEIRAFTAPVHQFDAYVVGKMWKQEYATELQNLEFVYTDKSSRLFHPIQAIKTEHRRPLLESAGLKWHYDIRCCAPTLIHQHAQSHGMDEYLFGLTSFLNNRSAYRACIADECELSEEHGFADKTAKIIINAMFCGARLGKSEQFKLTQLLNNDTARIEWLQQDEQVTQLREDIKTCWEYIKPSLTRRSQIDKNGRTRMLPISSKQKWARYFELERQVLEAARAYLRQTENKCFLEHDGWSTAKQVDIHALQQFVYNRTSFKIEVDCESLLETSNAAATHLPALALTPHPLASLPATVFPHSLVSRDRDIVVCSAPASIPHVYDKSNSPISGTWLRDFLRRRRAICGATA